MLKSPANWRIHGLFFIILEDNESILKQARQNTTLKIYEGPALILKAYMAAGLTDLFGDVLFYCL
jgi:hypothetical protein